MITNEQFKEFEDVRNEGQFNMFDLRARKLTSLNKEQWVEIMKDYGTLKKRYESTSKEPSPVLDGTDGP